MRGRMGRFGDGKRIVKTAQNGSKGHRVEGETILFYVVILLLNIHMF